jgi:hypothetical protein
MDFFSLWSLRKYGVLLVPMTQGLYEVSKDRNFFKLVVFLLVNNIFNPNNPFFLGIPIDQFFFARSGT